MIRIAKIKVSQRTACVTIIVVAFAGCNSKHDAQTGSPTSRRSVDSPADDLLMIPLNSPSVGSGKMFQVLSPEATGVKFINRLLDEHNVPYIYMGAGVATGDYDNDGRVDIYLLSVDGPNRLYRQIEDFKFVDVTDAAGVDGGEAWSRGATFFDSDNDGDLDLYVCNTEAPNLLYVNQGNGKFIESAKSLGADVVGACVMAGVADYDRDGDLDLYVTTHRALHHSVHPLQVERLKLPKNTNKSAEQLALRYEFTNVAGKLMPRNPHDYFQNLDHWEIAGQDDVLLRNNGDGTFVDVTDQCGIGSDPGLGLSCTWLDFDNDGWLDLHVANDLQSKDRLYRNNHDGTFTESLEKMLPNTTWYSMGSDFGDINNDGRFDYLVVDMASTTHYRAKVQMGDMDRFRYFMEQENPPQLMRNALYLNSGTQHFMEVAQMVGLHATDWTWSVKLNDLDNDGRIDAYFTNGIARADEMNPDLRMQRGIAQQNGVDALNQFIRAQGQDATSNRAYRNLGDLEFQDVSSQWGLDLKGISYGAAQADFDGDGDLDLVVNNHNEAATIYRNDSQSGNRAVFKLRGTSSNHFGIGAKVSLETENGIQVRQLFPNHGYMTCDEPILHFGLGDSERINRVTVQWPNGHQQPFVDLPVNHVFTVTENPPKNSVEAAKPSVRQFEDATESSGLEFKHVEFPYDDYGVQPLLPGKLSQLGPGLAWGDANADGKDDLFIGGAAGQSGQLFLNTGKGGFEQASGPWDEDKLCEDMAPLWIDVDSDDDLDLFVTSGSSEYDSGDPRLADRLYLNDGSGQFARAAADVVPTKPGSSSVVVAADYDADGDLDLFIGERSIPGQYPLSPNSYLLRNDNGKFIDSTNKDAPGLEKVGLVTGAIWSDANNDNRPDLLVTTEWGPVKFFRNEFGRLVDQTEFAGLQERFGWWNSIDAGDVNGDSFIDYVVMNVGLNTKYGKPTTDKPSLLYYGDMENSGLMQLIEVKNGANGLLPVRGLSCSSHAIPSLRDKFSTYHSFASSTLSEIYQPTCLEKADRFHANEFRSGLLMNDGTGKFNWQPLPRLAQISPGYGVQVADFNGDGRADIYFVQNLFTREPETGAWAGGISQLWLGDGIGGFRYLPTDQSGTIVTGDAKGMAVSDYDQDGWPDIVVARNNGKAMLLRNNGDSSKRVTTIRLVGPVGNPTGIGARVTIRNLNRVVQTSEVYAGSGYLSQSSAAICFVRPESADEFTVEVIWPDGQSSRTEISPSSPREIMVKHPARG